MLPFDYFQIFNCIYLFIYLLYCYHYESQTLFNVPKV